MRLRELILLQNGLEFQNLIFIFEFTDTSKLKSQQEIKSIFYAKKQ